MLPILYRRYLSSVHYISSVIRFREKGKEQWFLLKHIFWCNHFYYYTHLNRLLLFFMPWIESSKNNKSSDLVWESIVGEYVVHYAIWYHLHNLKNVKNSHGWVLILVNFTKINTPPCVFFMFLKLYKCYQIAQRITCTSNMRLLLSGVTGSKPR